MTLLRLALALVFGAALSQLPAFSDQYVQRLGGQVDALRQVAADFDASARRAGLTRAAALDDLSASEFQRLHQGDMRAAFSRLARAEADLALLRMAAPLERVLLAHRLRDPATLAATMGDFSPAVPVTQAGLTAAAIGGMLGWLLGGLLGRLLGGLFRRRPATGWR